jgi:hypothetical protein
LDDLQQDTERVKKRREETDRLIVVEQELSVTLADQARARTLQAGAIRKVLQGNDGQAPTQRQHAHAIATFKEITGDPEDPATTHRASL